MKWPSDPFWLRTLCSVWRSRFSTRKHRSRRGLPAAFAISSGRTIALRVEELEVRLVLSAAFDVTDLTDLRNTPQFADVDGALDDGTKIGIAVIDSGLLGSHVDLQSNFLAYFDAVATDANADVGRTRADTESAFTSFDPDGHGTHVSGIAASSNPDIGVAPRAGLIGIRGLPGPGESFPRHDTLLSGLQWVEENHQRYNIKVVNMSIQNGTNFNSVPNPNDIARQIDELEALGITVVSASGNAYADFAADPGESPTAGLGASFPAVFSSLNVANTWEDNGAGDSLPALGAGPRPRFIAIDDAPTADQFAGSSQRSTLDNQVAAPGTTILSTWNDGGFNTISGTSMAAPFVSGLVALVQDAAFTFGGRYLAVTEIVDIIRSSADTINDTETPFTRRGELVQDSAGNLSLGTIDNLAETGLDFLRVNALNAIVVTSQLFNPGSGDANNTLGTAIPFPALSDTQAFRVSGDIGTDGQIPVGPDDVDLFQITLAVPGQLRVEVELPEGGQAFDPYLRVFNSQGVEIARQNNRPDSNLYPDLTIPGILPPGVYYVGISASANLSYNPRVPNSGSGGNSLGDYEFTVTLASPDPNGVLAGGDRLDLTSPNVLNPNADLVSQRVFVATAVFEQEIGSDIPNEDSDDVLGDPLFEITELPGGDDVDLFQIVAPDTGRLFVETDTSKYGGTLDSLVRVFARNQLGQLFELGSNDNHAVGSTDSFVEVDVEIGKTYFIGVSNAGHQSYNPGNPFGRSSSSSDTGRYDLFVSFFNGDVNGTAFGAINFEDFDLDNNNVIDGVIGADFNQQLLGDEDGFKDVDFFQFTPQQDGLLDISTLGVDDNGNPLNGVVGVWELSPSLTDIVQIFDTTNSQPRTILEVSANQTLWVSVTGQGNSGFNWAAPGSGSGGDTGDYQLAVQELPLSDLGTLTNNSITAHSPTSLELGQTVSETIGFDGLTFLGGDDVDVFEYTAPENQIVVIRTLTLQEGSADTFLRVFDAEGNELAQNDDANFGTNASEVRILFEAGQTYFIGVNGNSTGAANYDARTGANAEIGSRGEYSLLMMEAAPPIYATGADAGGGPHVRIFDALNGTEMGSVFPYDPAFTGGVRLAVGDVTGDGIADVVTAPGPGGGPHIRMLNGATGTFDAEFFAFASGMTIGLNLALGDVNGDGFEDIIVAPDSGSSPVVRVFSGQDFSLIREFFAYDINLSGGVRVASGDVNGDGFSDIITVPGAGFFSHVRVFDGQNTPVVNGFGIGLDQAQDPQRVGSFFAFGQFDGGAYIASGDVNGDGFDDVIVSAGAGGGPHVQVFRGNNDGPFVLQSFFAYDGDFRGGVRVGTSESNFDNRVEILTSPGPGGGPHVRFLNADGAIADNFPYSTSFLGGVFVAGSGNFRIAGLRSSATNGFTIASNVLAGISVPQVSEFAVPIPSNLEDQLEENSSETTPNDGIVILPTDQPQTAQSSDETDSEEIALLSIRPEEERRVFGEKISDRDLLDELFTQAESLSDLL